MTDTYSSIETGPFRDCLNKETVPYLDGIHIALGDGIKVSYGTDHTSKELWEQCWVKFNIHFSNVRHRRPSFVRMMGLGMTYADAFIRAFNQFVEQAEQGQRVTVDLNINNGDGKKLSRNYYLAKNGESKFFVGPVRRAAMLARPAKYPNSLLFR